MTSFAYSCTVPQAKRKGPLPIITNHFALMALPGVAREARGDSSSARGGKTWRAAQLLDRPTHGARDLHFREGDKGAHIGQRSSADHSRIMI